MAAQPASWQRTGQGIPRSYYLKQFIPSYNPRGAALWGATGLTAALFLVQPFNWIDKTFINPPPPEETGEADVPPAAKK
jgi:hypothetical protein